MSAGTSMTRGSTLLDTNVSSFKFMAPKCHSSVIDVGLTPSPTRYNQTPKYSFSSAPIIIADILAKYMAFVKSFGWFSLDIRSLRHRHIQIPQDVGVHDILQMYRDKNIISDIH